MSLHINRTVRLLSQYRVGLALLPTLILPIEIRDSSLMQYSTVSRVFRRLWTGLRQHAV